MRHLTLCVVAVIACVATAAHSAADEGNGAAKPAWRYAGAIVTVYGEVKTPGTYLLPGRPKQQPLLLKQVVYSAGLKEGKGMAVILMRADEKDGGKTARSLEIPVDRLNEDGAIELRPNDVIKVVAAQ